MFQLLTELELRLAVENRRVVCSLFQYAHQLSQLRSDLFLFFSQIFLYFFLNKLYCFFDLTAAQIALFLTLQRHSRKQFLHQTYESSIFYLFFFHFLQSSKQLIVLACFHLNLVEYLHEDGVNVGTDSKTALLQILLELVESTQQVLLSATDCRLELLNVQSQGSQPL